MTTTETRPDAPAKPPLAETDHVLTAIRAVMSDVIGIAKAGEMRQNRGDVQYNFQRYDDMAAAVGRAFRTAGVATQTLVTGRDHYHWEKPTQSGKTLWTWVQVDIRFVLTSLVDGSTFTVEALGEGLDSSDKATNKAMTSAYKNALRIAFTLSTADDDPDATRPQVDTPPETARNAPQNGHQTQPPDPREAEVWRALENIARQAPELNSEQSRLDIAAQAMGAMSRCRTTGDLAALAAWALGKGALTAPAGDSGVSLAQRMMAARGTLRVGPRSQAAQQTDRPQYQPSPGEVDRAVRELPRADTPPDDGPYGGY